MLAVPAPSVLVVLRRRTRGTLVTAAKVHPPRGVAYLAGGTVAENAAITGSRRAAGRIAAPTACRGVVAMGMAIGHSILEWASARRAGCRAMAASWVGVMPRARAQVRGYWEQPIRLARAGGGADLGGLLAAKQATPYRASSPWRCGLTHSPSGSRVTTMVSVNRVTALVAGLGGSGPPPVAGRRVRSLPAVPHRLAESPAYRPATTSGSAQCRSGQNKPVVAGCQPAAGVGRKLDDALCSPRHRGIHHCLEREHTLFAGRLNVSCPRPARRCVAVPDDRDLAGVVAT